MKTAIKPLVFQFLKEWIYFIGITQIVNAVVFMITGTVAIAGPVWQIAFPAVMVLVLRWIPRYNNWLDRRLKR
jgi:hypothetical protein